MSTITAILDPDADGSLHLPLPEELRHCRVRVEAKLEAADESESAPRLATPEIIPTMTATIQKWGDSLAVRLPTHFAEEAHLGEGKEVELVSTEEGVLLRSRKKVRYRLADLVAGITPQNTHPETDWGAEVGREIVE